MYVYVYVYATQFASLSWSLGGAHRLGHRLGLGLGHRRLRHHWLRYHYRMRMHHLWRWCCIGELAARLLRLLPLLLLLLPLLLLLLLLHLLQRTISLGQHAKWLQNPNTKLIGAQENPSSVRVR